jgi:hypothetical protein
MAAGIAQFVPGFTVNVLWVSVYLDGASDNVYKRFL